MQEILKLKDAVMNQDFLEICSKMWDLAKLYPTSVYGSYKYRQLFEGIKTYAMFIGYPRSDHSLIGALLDAHPNMIFAHELDALKFVYARYTKKQIYYLLLETSRLNAERGRKSGQYSYEVPNQWQGDFNTLQVIGDKKGGGSTLRLRAFPRLLDRLRKTIGPGIKFIHVVRNPFDNISTMSRKTKWLKSLTDSIDHYFSLCETIMDIKKQLKEDELFELRHELFLENPKAHLKDLCYFLGVGAPDDYLNDCSGIVYESPHKSRNQSE